MRPEIVNPAALRIFAIKTNVRLKQNYLIKRLNARACGALIKLEVGSWKYEVTSANNGNAESLIRTSYLKRLSAQSWFWLCTSYDGEGVLFVGGFVVDNGARAVGFEFDGEAFAVFGRFACVVLYRDVGGVDGVANYAPFAFGVSDYENARRVLH